MRLLRLTIAAFLLAVSWIHPTSDLLVQSDRTTGTAVVESVCDHYVQPPDQVPRGPHIIMLGAVGSVTNLLPADHGTLLEFPSEPVGSPLPTDRLLITPYTTSDL